MQDWGVGELRSVSEAVQVTGKQPLWGKGVDRNKGDEERPNIRSRSVACEVATYRDDSLFAATPPLEALRLLLSYATERPSQEEVSPTSARPGARPLRERARPG